MKFYEVILRFLEFKLCAFQQMEWKLELWAI